MISRLLIVDDDNFLAESLTRFLSGQDYDVVRAGTADEAWQMIEAQAPDLALLDLGLPDQDGISLCRRIRGKWKFPILMLTSRSEAIDKVLGLEAGADDYLPKPFDRHELLARIRALLRRVGDYQNPAANLPLKSGDLEIDEEARRATIKGNLLELTETEYKILVYLAKNSGRAISREQLFSTIWGYEMAFNSNSLEVLIYRLRGKITEAGGGTPISTLRGYGYKWEA